MAIPLLGKIELVVVLFGFILSRRLYLRRMYDPGSQTTVVVDQSQAGSTSTATKRGNFLEEDFDVKIISMMEKVQHLTRSMANFCCSA